MHDPHYCNVHLDTNALDRDGIRDALVERLLALEDDGKISLIKPNSVLGEISHPHTPANVQAVMQSGIHTLPVSRTPEELAKLSKIQTILQGKSRSGKHDADAEHLFEAQKYGGGYFITHDRRILSKLDELRREFGLNIVTLKKFLEVYDHFVAAG